MNALNTPVYMHDSFGHLVSLLFALKVFGIRYHKVSHSAVMLGIGTRTVIQPHWIPVPIIDVSAKFIEIIPRKEMEKDEFTT